MQAKNRKRNSSLKKKKSKYKNTYFCIKDLKIPLLKSFKKIQKSTEHFSSLLKIKST